MDVYPTQLNLDEQGRELVIQWSDDQTRRYGFKELRDNCPCATCREKRKEAPAAPNPLQVLTPEQLVPLAVVGMRPVGNYAYAIAFSDGHDTGIYTLERLRELGRLSNDA
ncbi:MAG: DUF971 domain-containing protein [Planctomycetales bacterium]|nr:DUF971 domain-containing protein [Planctomycetales bacterium]